MSFFENEKLVELRARPFDDLSRLAYSAIRQHIQAAIANLGPHQFDALVLADVDACETLHEAEAKQRGSG
jgi:hypothetical protein